MTMETLHPISPEVKFQARFSKETHTVCFILGFQNVENCLSDGEHKLLESGGMYSQTDVRGVLVTGIHALMRNKEEAPCCVLL